MLLWRYLTLDGWDRFERDERIPLSRIGGFSDAFECALPQYSWIAQQRRDGIDQLDNEVLTKLLNQAARQRWNFASCWFADEQESIAMWDLYVGHHETGVAIAVKFPDLAEHLPESAILSPVQYVRASDADAIVDLVRDDLWPFYKLWGYNHEREVRVVVPGTRDEVEVSDPEGRWGCLRESDLRSLVVSARVLAPRGSQRKDLLERVGLRLPDASVRESRAYPTTYRYQDDDWWIEGMEPGDNWQRRMAGTSFDPSIDDADVNDPSEG